MDCWYLSIMMIGAVLNGPNQISLTGPMSKIECDAAATALVRTSPSLHVQCEGTVPGGTVIQAYP